MGRAQFLIAVCAIHVAVGAPQLNIPGVRTVTNTRESVTTSNNQNTLPIFPSIFKRNQDVEAEISSITVENQPQVSSVFKSNSLTTSQNKGSDGNDALAVLTNRFSSSSGSLGSGLTTRTQSSSSVSKSSGNSDDEIGMPYSFNYNVADDDFQTYIAREEQSDGETTVGSYSYVDPTGALITVNYRAGLMGYTETRERQANFLKIRSSPVKASKQTKTTSTSTGSSATSTESRFSGSSKKSASGTGSAGGAQQLTTTVTKKKSVDQAALIAQILAALQPQISNIVDSSIDEFEEVTEEKTVTVQKIPTASSTFQFSEQSSSVNSN